MTFCINPIKFIHQKSTAKPLLLKTFIRWIQKAMKHPELCNRDCYNVNKNYMFSIQTLNGLFLHIWNNIIAISIAITEPCWIKSSLVFFFGFFLVILLICILSNLRLYCNKKHKNRGMLMFMFYLFLCIIFF